MKGSKEERKEERKKNRSLTFSDPFQGTTLILFASESSIVFHGDGETSLHHRRATHGPLRLHKRVGDSLRAQCCPTRRQPPPLIHAHHLLRPKTKDSRFFHLPQQRVAHDPWWCARQQLTAHATVSRQSEEGGRLSVGEGERSGGRYEHLQCENTC